jgi:hypothetical protein
MILMALLLVGRQERGHYIKVSVSDWVLIFGGAFIILYTYLVDYGKLLFESGALGADSSPETAERLVTMISSYIPDRYRWLLFIAGEVLIVAAITNILIRSRKYSKDETVN